MTGIGLCEFPIQFREHNGADAVDKGRGQRRKDLIRVIEGAGHPGAELFGVGGVGQIAEEIRRSRYDGHNGHFGKVFDVGLPKTDHRTVKVPFPDRVGKSHGELQQPRRRYGDHIHQNGFPLHKQEQSQDQKDGIGQTHAPLQGKVIHGLIHRHHQISDDDHRQCQRHDPQKDQRFAAHRGEEHIAQRRHRNKLPKEQADQTDHQGKSHEVIGNILAFFAAFRHGLGDDGHGGDAHGVGDGGKQIDGLVIRGVKGVQSPENIGLDGFSQDPENLGQNGDHHHAADGRGDAFFLPRRFRIFGGLLRKRCFFFLLRNLIHHGFDPFIVSFQTGFQLRCFFGGGLKDLLAAFHRFAVGFTEFFQRKVIGTGDTAPTDGIHKRVHLGVVGDPDGGHIHDGGKDQGMEANPHEAIEITNDGKDLVAQIFLPNAVHFAVETVGDPIHHGGVLFIMEGNQHGIHMISIIQPADGARDLLKERRGQIGRFDRPAHNGPPFLFFQSDGAEDLLPLFGIGAADAHDGVGGHGDLLPWHADIRKEFRRCFVADGDLIHFFQVSGRQAAVERAADGPDPLRVQKDFLFEHQRHADHEQIVKNTAVGSDILQKRAAAEDQQITVFDRL